MSGVKVWGSRLWSRSGVKIDGGVKVGGSRSWDGVKVWGFKVVVKVVGSRSWGQGQGYDQWSQSRGQCRGSKSGVNEGQGLGSWGQMVGWVYCGGEVVDK